MTESFEQALHSLLSPAEIIDRDSAASLWVDERQQFHGKALASVAPSSVGKVAELVKLCQSKGIAIVPQGGNTGYCGGATPDADGTQLLLSLKNLNRCRAVDVNGRSITVEAGMVLHDVQMHAEEHGLLFPLSMGSEGSCQIGGNLSTNAGGLAVLRYGTARELVLGLEVVLADGSILNELKTLRKDTTGYDLKQLFLGAEGTLGIITAASLKLFAKPTSNLVAWLALPDEQVLAPLLRQLQSIVGDVVSSFEYISRPSLDYVLENVEDVRDPLQPRYEHYALVEFAGFQTATDFSALCQQALNEAVTQGLIRDAVIANSESQARALWKLRETIPRAEKLLGGSIKHDVSVPISRMNELIAKLIAALNELDERARLSIYGHVGDGNVHFNVLPPQGVDFSSYKQSHGQQISTIVHHLAAEERGSFSAEHGVGQLKLHDLEQHASPERLHTMRTIKRALDPNNIMNPGKVLRI